MENLYSFRETPIGHFSVRRTKSFFQAVATGFGLPAIMFQDGGFDLAKSILTAVYKAKKKNSS